MIKKNWKWILGLLLVILFFSYNDVSITSMILLIGAVLVIWGLFGFRSKPKDKTALPDLSDKLASHYSENGMTPSEISYFRETMNQTKNEIEQLEKNMHETAKLKAIDLRHEPVKAAKGLFKELVKEPTRLHDASQFLYTHLPNLVDLTNKYIEINAHEIKNKQTYQKLEESNQIIDQLALLVAKDYQDFVSEDLEDIDVEISVAKQSLKRDNKEEQEE
ncbi:MULTISPECIES: 5-bromo-4-chloroindolyl phosphate hydrolysis family protein [Enterococcus]|uniref:5-bromo-4-chloroindolyl phosphate hydrolysis protein n=1 Tax=Candidatus Enterococcus mangumiae TaxID=2230878 RepID=A0ABZ2SX40_9ENTE|nr:MULTISPECIES: 5-bromo-4-chloroindolyl phosphate hydrolysis family protein [unclassified Enterococcus]MBO0490378.1 5-bromo-4-chloroindolyl phosphate hydrolysis family protein [Enterococcus sp. DIV1094]MBO1300347.1 5-bromo-4-chloroindolyl phosphate hydrolysis family protein [Enterococcus sp. DIV1271a]